MGHLIRKTLQIILLFIITVLLIISGYDLFRDKTMEVINLNLKPLFPEIHYEYFMEKNPPENIDSIVAFFFKEAARAPVVLKASKWKIDTTLVYGHKYYEERFFFDRTYKVPRYFWGRIFDHHDIRYGTTHQKDLSFVIMFKTDDFILHKNLRVTFPYLIIYKKNYIYVYCPNGFKNIYITNGNAYRYGELTVMVVPIIITGGEWIGMKAATMSAKLAGMGSKADDVLAILKNAEKQGYTIVEETNKTIIKNGDEVTTIEKLPDNEVRIVNGAGKTGIQVIDDFLALAPKIDNIAPNSIPAGYQVITKNGSKYIRRIDATNPSTPRLMVDQTGTIVPYVKPQRLASNNLLRSRLEQANGGVMPDGHQAHHLVPDNVVQNSPVYQEAINRGLYDIDRVSNGKLLAETAEDYAPLSEAYPTHFGSHPNYDIEIVNSINDVLEIHNVLPS